MYHTNNLAAPSPGSLFRPVLWALLITALAVGCSTIPHEISGISCEYSFTNIQRKEDQKRVDDAIRSIAVGGTVNKSGPVSDPVYRFRVARFSQLQDIHGKLLFQNPSAGKESERGQVLNPRTPEFSMKFDSTDIAASIDVILKFTINQGSQLFYKDQGGSEKNITSMVDSRGRVTLPTKIKRGQEYIFARTVLDNVTRYIKIDVFSQQVTDITKAEY
jgi:hypothetical protein